jgi:hypothetical protein
MSGLHVPCCEGYQAAIEPTATKSRCKLLTEMMELLHDSGYDGFHVLMNRPGSLSGMDLMNGSVSLTGASEPDAQINTELKDVMASLFEDPDIILCKHSRGGQSGGVALLLAPDHYCVMSKDLVPSLPMRTDSAEYARQQQVQQQQQQGERWGVFADLLKDHAIKLHLLKCQGWRPAVLKLSTYRRMHTRQARHNCLDNALNQ